MSTAYELFHVSTLDRAPQVPLNFSLTMISGLFDPDLDDPRSEKFANLSRVIETEVCIIECVGNRLSLISLPVDFLSEKQTRCFRLLWPRAVLTLQLSAYEASKCTYGHRRNQGEGGHPCTGRRICAKPLRISLRGRRWHDRRENVNIRGTA